MCSAHSQSLQRSHLILEPVDAVRLLNLCGPMDQNLRQIEKAFDVKIQNRGHRFSISGAQASDTAQVIRQLYSSSENEALTPDAIHLYLQEKIHHKDHASNEPQRKTVKSGKVTANGAHQEQYLENIQRYDLSFGIGPAGTGKTYLAVAAAIEALLQRRVKRLVLARPAVEAGERLGFLPGDMAQKVDPYLRPVYDALYSLLGIERVNKLIERGDIEVAPLAYMRGRSLNHAFIILDEAQNTTPQQMKMFLTRIGFDSKAVVTGDVTQIDLPHHQQSGLQHAATILRSVAGIGFTFFDARDVVRHRLVKNIVQAYEADQQDS